MKLYSTRNKEIKVSLKEAVLKGLATDGGLFMPETIPSLSSDFIKNIKQYSFQEIAFEVCNTFFQQSIPENDLKEIINNSITFPAPIVQLDSNKYVLELFHGPTLAFKDFGARFMAQLMRYFNKENTTETVILVATSGDTGGAVASGFYKVDGIKVVILYPSGKVSDLQEKQLTTLGHNISALEVSGTFDDCQALVKQAFLDKDLCSKIQLSSANSINIARLIPQMLYYFEAYKQLPNTDKPVVFSIPSGNFGNLTAGLFAKKMGLPIYKFIAATNINNVVPEYLTTGEYSPRPSKPTISNAMDVGRPSNFERMMDLYGFTWNTVKKDIVGFSYDDNITRKAVKEVYNNFEYTIDPHGGVGYLALKAFQKENDDVIGVILETAHPAKFIREMEGIDAGTIQIPERLAILKDKTKEATPINTSYENLSSYLERCFT